MRRPSLLNLGNIRKVQANLAPILDEAALEQIETEIQRNVSELMDLAMHHYRFAKGQPNPFWRQRISRLYYAAYNAARAVRLFVSGEYSTDGKDHQKFSQLPEDFPNRQRYVAELPVLREDRNTCDYDHLSSASSLTLGSKQSTELVHGFLLDVRHYLKAKGMIH